PADSTAADSTTVDGTAASGTAAAGQEAHVDVELATGAPRHDQIRITGIAATGFHGVFEHERRDGQSFRVDLVLHVDLRRAAEADDLSHTVDYGVLAQEVAAIVTGPPVDLIETLATRIAEAVLAHPGVEAVDVTVHKP